MKITAAALLLAASLAVPAAAHADNVPSVGVADSPGLLGGGAGITVNGTFCTLATIGHDNSGALVGLTAATCGGPGSSVGIEGGAAGVGT
jgi:hypothetical protein